MAEERNTEKNQFIERKLYDDKKHITIKDMMAYIDAYCPDKKEWFKDLLLATKVNDAGNDEPAHTTLELKKMFYEECVPKKEKIPGKKKSRREKLIDDMGW